MKLSALAGAVLAAGCMFDDRPATFRGTVMSASPMTPPAAAPSMRTRPASMPEPEADPADADAADNEMLEVACKPQPGDECDIAVQCGCEIGQRCRSIGGVARCWGESSGKGLRRGERCNGTGECGGELECPSTGYCSLRCAFAADCPGQQCQHIANGRAPFDLVRDHRVCVSACDPVGAAACSSGSTCVPTLDLALQESAVCSAIGAGAADGTPKQTGDECGSHASCDRGLGCAIAPGGTAGVCTPWCRRDADCPSARPECLLGGPFLARSGDGVGQCMPATQIASDMTSDDTDSNAPDPSDPSAQNDMGAAAGSDASDDAPTPMPEPIPMPDVCASLPEPAGFGGGPVWTNAELEACLQICQTDECVSLRCNNGVAFNNCMRASIAKCAGREGGSCRAAYLADACCMAKHCDGAVDRQVCDQQYCPAEESAFEACWGQEEACVEEATSACIM